MLNNKLKSGFKKLSILFCFALCLGCLVLGFGVTIYSGSLPIIKIIGLGGALILLGKTISIISIQYFEISKQYLSDVLSQFNILVIVNLLGFWSLCSYFFIDGIMFHDTSTFYSNFYDQLHSLNYFGEPAWWYPNIQHGFPGYFFAILVNVNALSPIFFMVGTIFLVLGKLGIVVTEIFPIYIWYFGFIIPFVFSISIWLLSRQILRSSIAIYYICIVASISPGLILNYTDSGLIEITAYGFFFAASFLNFIKKPSSTNKLILIISLGVVCLTMGYAFLAFVFLFLSFFFLVQFLPVSPVNQMTISVRSISIKSWITIIITICICSMPPLITMKQRGDIERTTIEKNPSPYQFMTRGSGNSLDVFIASTPGIGLKGSNNFLSPVMDGGDGWSFYNYLGILALPLALFGFLYSKSYWRLRLFILMVLYFSVLIFQNYSPLFFPILSLNTLLTSISHFNDLTYRSGGFVIILLAAGLGLEALCERRIPRFSALIILSSSLLFSLVLIKALSISSIFVYGFLLGFIALIGLSCFIVFSWLDTTKSSVATRNFYFKILLAITVIDVMTISHLHVRTNFFKTFVGIQNPHNRYDEQNHDKIGLQNIIVNANTTTTLQAKTFINLLDLDRNPNELPQHEIFEKFYFSNRITNLDIDNALSKKALALSKPSEGSELLKLNDENQINFRGEITGILKTYNTRYISLLTNKPAILFIRDARHPYWYADINGVPAQIFTALGHYKAIALPAGASEIRLRFEPFGVLSSFSLAYSLIIFLLLILGFKVLKMRKSC
jgi:hypothetical protein